MWVATTKFTRKYRFSTSTSHASTLLGKFRNPNGGIRCQKRSGLPMSTMTNIRHMVMALMASNSP